MSDKMFQLIVPLRYLSDENPKFAQMVEELLECVRKQNYIPSYATDMKMEGLRIEEIEMASRRE